MGIGLILVVSSAEEARVITSASELGDRAYRIGEIVTGEEGSLGVEYVE